MNNFVYFLPFNELNIARNFYLQSGFQAEGKIVAQKFCILCGKRQIFCSSAISAFQSNQIKDEQISTFCTEFRVELNMQYCGQILRVHLRHTKRFYDVNLLGLSAKSTFKIINLGRYVFRIGFFLNYELTATKNCRNRLENLENKYSCLIIRFYNISLLIKIFWNFY